MRGFAELGRPDMSLQSSSFHAKALLVNPKASLQTRAQVPKGWELKLDGTYKEPKVPKLSVIIP